MFVYTVDFTSTYHCDRSCFWRFPLLKADFPYTLDEAQNVRCAAAHRGAPYPPYQITGAVIRFNANWRTTLGNDSARFVIFSVCGILPKSDIRVQVGRRKEQRQFTGDAACQNSATDDEGEDNLEGLLADFKEPIQGIVLRVVARFLEHIPREIIKDAGLPRKKIMCFYLYCRPRAPDCDRRHRM